MKLPYDFGTMALELPRQFASPDNWPLSIASRHHGSSFPFGLGPCWEIVLKKRMWIRLSVVWEDLIILSGCSKKVVTLHPQRKISSIQFTSLFLRCQTFCTFNISFVQTCRIRSQPHDYPCFQLLPIWSIQIQVWCGHIQGSQEEIQKWRDYIMLVPYLRSIKWLISRTRLIHFAFSSIVLATSLGWRFNGDQSPSESDLQILLFFPSFHSAKEEKNLF